MAAKIAKLRAELKNKIAIERTIQLKRKIELNATNKPQNKITFRQRKPVLHRRILKNSTDCEFDVGGEKFTAHKLTLSSSSPVFKAMFYGGLAEDSTVFIDDIEPEIFDLLLNYIYMNVFEVGSVRKVMKLTYAAHKYLITSLQQKCTDYLKSSLNSTNVFEIYECSRFFSERELEVHSIQYIIQNTSDVLKKSNYARVSIDTLVTVLKLPQLAINSELELFSAVEKWVEKNLSLDSANDDEASSSAKKSKQSCSCGEIYFKEPKVQEAMKRIRFLTLTPIEFISGPSASKILKPSESLAILSNLVSPNRSKHPYPVDFCAISARRTTNSYTDIPKSRYTL